MKERDTAKPSDLVSTDVLLRHQDCKSPSSYALPALPSGSPAGFRTNLRDFAQVMNLQCPK